MKFTEARLANGFIRCMACGHLDHKDGCFQCEDCDGYSCEKCGFVRSGWDMTVCEECDTANKLEQAAIHRGFGFANERGQYK